MDTPKREMKREIFRADMSRCEPSTALSRTHEPGRWQLVNYETEEGVKGVMVYAHPNEKCPELKLPLNVKGLHRICLGINYAKSPRSDWPSSGQLEVKLTGDLGYQRVSAESGAADESGVPKFPESQELYKSIQEAYWKTADLTGQSIMIRQPHEPYSSGLDARFSNLAYIKLQPLERAEIESWRTSRSTSATRRLALIYCTAHMTGSTDGTATFHPKTEQWVENEFTSYADSDIGVLVFEAMRGNFCLFKTNIGDVGSEDGEWSRDWIDPLASFTKFSHKYGIKCFAALRMIGPQYPMNRSPLARSRHYWQHPEWAKKDRDGIPLSNWSLAFPGARQYWLSLLREALAYGIDGIQLHLNRSTPFVFYEEPTVQGFMEKYGEDPRKLSPADPRWIQHSAGFLTQFIREVRELVDEKPERSLAVTVFGPTKENEQDPHFKLKSYVCDVEEWLKQGLVDYVMPSKSIDPEALRKWRHIAKDRVHLWPDLMPRGQPAESYAKLAKAYYAAGADGLCLWDGERRHPRISEWAAVKNLGHTEQLDRIIQEGPGWYRHVVLRKLGGFAAENSFRDG